MLGKLFGLTPFIIFLAVAGSLLAALTLVVYGFIVIIDLTWELIRDAEVSRHRATILSIEFIEMIDIFLIGVILLIVGLGLYQLFIDERVDVPDWLVVHNLDQLKHKLVGVVSVVLGVTFLTSAAEWDGGTDILYYGAAIALVLVALVALLLVVDIAVQHEIREIGERKKHRTDANSKPSRPTVGTEPPEPQ